VSTVAGNGTVKPNYTETEVAAVIASLHSVSVVLARFALNVKACGVNFAGVFGHQHKNWQFWMEETGHPMSEKPCCLLLQHT
jgi:hypothetical protein